jgi:glycosyltransferase involved in cell wall biosynthesis
MIASKLADKVLTIGPVAKPLGGISQVIINYRDYIFPHMHRLEFNTGKSGWTNVWAFFRVIFGETFLLLRHRSLSIVHLHTASGITFLRVFFFWLIAKMLFRKTVMHIHAGSFGDYYHTHPCFVRFVLNHSTRVVALSEEWKIFFEKEVNLNNVVVVNNLIPLPNYTPHEHTNIIHFLFLGHMVAAKGIFDLLSVMSTHADELRNRMFLHICGSKNEDEVLRIIEEHHLEDFVKFEGWVTSNRKTELLNQCDVFILPSYIEGVPLSILECMTYRMGIIATRIGGIPSIVHEGENGFLFEPGDKQSLFNYIKQYIEHQETISLHGYRSYNISQNHLPESVSLSLTSLYTSILNS